MSGIDSGALSQLLLRIHEAALEPESWPAVLNHIADVIGAQSSNLLVVNAATGTETLGFLEGQDPDSYRVYMRDYFPQDIRVARMARALPTAILQDRDLWNEAERLNSPLFHDYQRVNRLFEITGANLSTAGQLIWCGFAREEATPFEDEALKVLRLVLPHVRQAVRHHLQRTELADQRDLLWQNADRALLLLGADGRLRYCNAAAEDLAGSGLFTLAAGSLCFADSTTQIFLTRALAALRRGQALPANCHALLAVDQSDGRQYGLRLMASEHAAGSALLVSLAALDCGRFGAAEVERFATLFSLTPAETRAVAAVAEGQAIDDFARSLAIQPDTARKQLKSAMSKAGCHSQKDLVRMVERFCFLSLR